MEKASYLKCILKNLKVTKKKKQEFYNDLCSEIDNALESGESWSSIESRMGNPSEVAREFNENLDEKDRVPSTHTKIIIGVIGVVLFAAILSIGIYLISRPASPTSDSSATPSPNNSIVSSSFDVAKIKKNTTKIASLIDQNQFDELIRTYFSSTLKEGGVTTDALQQAKAKATTNAGAYQNAVKTESISEFDNEQGHFVTHVVSAKYEKKDVIYTLSFDTDCKLVGIYMR